MPLVCVVLSAMMFQDVSLCEAWQRADSDETRSACLVAMTRHPGPITAVFLEQKYRELTAGRKKGRGLKPQVELLTALRRIQGHDDPLQILVHLPEKVESVFPHLPEFQVSLINFDQLEEDIVFTEGGDYRSGRQARWRFRVVDAKGQVIPVKPLPGLISEGGGLVSNGLLEPGDTWETLLPMSKFSELIPGDYTVVVEYHDRARIADQDDTKALLVCRSEPFTLHVQPRVVDITKADRQEAAAAIAALPKEGSGPVLISVGRYDTSSHKFIPPDSAAGRLLTLGWRAVPTLLDALEDKTASEVRRAWLFAMLHSITGWNNPLYKSVLAGYRYQSRGWSVVGGRGGNIYPMGLGSGHSESSTGGKIDKAAQEKFAREWLAFRDYFVVRERR
ncbi:MAG: hypothetical protein ACRC8S_01685 [Fimbriiglobus sp.]